jgi:hypothetical protein
MDALLVFRRRDVEDDGEGVEVGEDGRVSPAAARAACGHMTLATSLKTGGGREEACFRAIASTPCTHGAILRGSKSSFGDQSSLDSPSLSPPMSALVAVGAKPSSRSSLSNVCAEVTAPSLGLKAVSARTCNGATETMECGLSR